MCKQIFIIVLGIEWVQASPGHLCPQNISQVPSQFKTHKTLAWLWLGFHLVLPCERDNVQSICLSEEVRVLYVLMVVDNLIPTILLVMTRSCPTLMLMAMRWASLTYHTIFTSIKQFTGPVQLSGIYTFCKLLGHLSFHHWCWLT